MKKPKKVSVIRHPCGISVDVLMDQNSLEFSANPIEGIYFKEKSADVLRSKVWKYLDENIQLVWTPVISVTETTPFATNDYAFIGLEVDRFYVGKSNSGELRSLRWCDFDDTDKLERIRMSQKFYGFSEIKFPQHGDAMRDSQVHYLAYTESLWAAVNKIREGIAKLKQQFRETIGSDAGIKRLESFGSKIQNLLPEKTK